MYARRSCILGQIALFWFEGELWGLYITHYINILMAAMCCIAMIAFFGLKMHLWNQALPWFSALHFVILLFWNEFNETGMGICILDWFDGGGGGWNWARIGLSWVQKILVNKRQALVSRQTRQSASLFSVQIILEL